jgi:hypothetical protein
MVFDGLEESYFAFVKETRRRVPEGVAQQIEELEPTTGDRKFLAPGEGTGAFSHAASKVGVTSSPDGGYRTFAGSPSVLSAGALRRLRERSGVRTKRAASAGGTAKKSPRFKLLLYGGVGLALVAAALLVALLL